MIDVLLVLLVIFMATLPLSQRGLDLNLPSETQPQASVAPPDQIVLGALSVGGVNTSGAPATRTWRGGVEQQREPFTLALTGDSIITQRLSPFKEPEFTGLMDKIRNADAAFTNLETLFHDYEAPPAHESGGTWMRTDPPILKELVWAGFDLVSRANNHAGDFGALGAQITSRYVREAGLVEAGVGNSLNEAREARFLETPKARVALISAASIFTPHSRAGNTRGDMPARLEPAPFHHHLHHDARPHTDLKRVASESKLATGTDATRILEMMTARSKAFGATVTVKGGVGYVVPTP